MEMMRVLCVVVSASLAACWHGGGTTAKADLGEPQPLSFVARVQGLDELQRKTNALEPRLAEAMHRILRLSTETDRVTIGDDLNALTERVERLTAELRKANGAAAPKAAKAPRKTAAKSPAKKVARRASKATE